MRQLLRSCARGALHAGDCRVAAAAVARQRRSASDLRNFGIIAHVDAGKTTTTEQMLLSAQVKGRKGAVDSGTTTTDFMDQERERGITIQSAVVHFPWQDCHLYLIDTPGHADFNIEVERSLRVLDGAVAVFDGAKGVEAQSRTVLRQAERFLVPFLSYVNKMDRPQADYTATLDQIEQLIGTTVLPTQAPIWEAGAFVGVCDVINWVSYRWHGSEIKGCGVDEEAEEVKVSAVAWRTRLLESLSDVSDAVSSEYLGCMEQGDDAGRAVPADLITTEVAAAVRSRRATAALCGSSARGVGVEPLLDAACLYLPSPTQRPPLTVPDQDGGVVTVCGSFGPKDPTVAFVFKVQVDGKTVSAAHKVVLLRVYSGTLKCGRMHNVTRGRLVSVREIRVMQGGEWEKASELGPGQIGAVSGLDECGTGDTLASSKDTRPLEGLLVPSPVVTATLEPYSTGELKTMKAALNVLMLEDPTLHTGRNEYGQTLISGMGALHLDIAKTKLERKWDLSVTMGEVRIKFLERLERRIHYRSTYRTGDDVAVLSLSFSVGPLPLLEFQLVPENGVETVQFPLSDHTSLSDADRKKLLRKLAEPLAQGFRMGLSRGPRIGQELRGCTVHVDKIEVHSAAHANEDTVRTAADYAVHCLFEETPAEESTPLEPCMEVEVRVWDAALQSCVEQHLLGPARADLISSTEGCIRAVVPLMEMQQYPETLASLTEGNSSLQYRYKGYRPVLAGSVLKVACGRRR